MKWLWQQSCALVVVMWPLIVAMMRTLLMNFPFEVLGVAGVLNVGCKLVCCVQSWWMHMWLAGLISEWHRAGLRAKMKKKGIKFKPRPGPPPLTALPHHLMVLSAVMMSMWSVALAGHVSLVPPVTWVEAIGGVRGLIDELDAHPPVPRKPPDPSSNGEGRGATVHDDSACAVNCLSDADAAELESFEIEVGCVGPCSGECACQECMKSSSGLWSDLSKHVCFVANLVPSFGPLGLMSVEEDHALMEAIVDTGASICITPCRSDFVTFEPQSGKVIKGLTQGSSIQGVGVVSWRIEVGGTTVELKLRALFVPAASARLLCPQQVKREHTPRIPPPTIEDDCVRFEFAEGVVECAFNDSNLPVVKLCTTQEAASQLESHALLCFPREQPELDSGTEGAAEVALQTLSH